jgi:hypothetical protein
VKRWPIIPTIIVIIAVAIMIGLGVWQLQRKAEKEALLARYNAADGLPAIAWPVVPDPKALPLFRRSTVMCDNVIKIESVSGSNRAGDAGFAHVASCQTGGAEGVNAKVAIGWSERPQSPSWSGGLVRGIIAPDLHRRKHCRHIGRACQGRICRAGRCCHADTRLGHGPSRRCGHVATHIDGSGHCERLGIPAQF